MVAKQMSAAVAAALLAGCVPFEKTSTIRVKGSAEVERPPDYFTLEATIRGRGATREAALTNAAATLSTINETVPRLEGLKKLALTSTAATSEPMRGPGCDDYDDEEDCPITGYRTEFTVSLKGGPATSAGGAYSLLSELGGEDVVLGSYGLDDPEAVRREAIKAAVEDARRKADAIAAASGASVKQLVEASYGADGQASYDGDEAIVVTANRLVSPKVKVPLVPEPIAVSVEVSAAFALQ